MPYIITTTDPQHVCLSMPERCGVEPIVTRRAVATLDEARDWGADIVQDRANNFSESAQVQSDYGYLAAVNAALDIDESGGTIGPLPDGTVIEVQQVM